MTEKDYTRWIMWGRFDDVHKVGVWDGNGECKTVARKNRELLKGKVWSLYAIRIFCSYFPWWRNVCVQCLEWCGCGCSWQSVASVAAELFGAQLSQTWFALDMLKSKWIVRITATTSEDSRAHIWSWSTTYWRNCLDCLL